MGPFCSVANPADLAFGPTDNLFVSSITSHHLLQFDGQTGDDMGPFCFVANPGSLVFKIKSPACDADINNDGMVDVSDVLSVISNWGSCKGCPEDIDQDGIVDVSDLLIVISNWGECE